MKKISRYKLASSDEKGFAAFAVTMIMMIVLSLIVLGFAANSRREQTNTLNNDLSTTAYYAAQSGINDAFNVIKNDLQNGDSIAAQTTSCSKDNRGRQSYISGASNILDGAANNTSYSCLLVNPAPATLEFRPISPGEGVVMPLNGQYTSATGNPTLSNVTISWQEHGAGNPVFSGCPSGASVSSTTGYFPQTSQYSNQCNASVLQVDLVDASSFGTKASPTFSVFAQPVASSFSSLASISDPSPSGQDVVPVHCGAPYLNFEYACTLTINVANNSDSYYMRILPFYSSSDVEVSATDGARPLDLVGAQAIIDSTGKAGNVLKRIQERVCISNVCVSSTPTSALQSTTGICKQFTTRPDVTFGTGIGPSPSC